MKKQYLYFETLSVDELLETEGGVLIHGSKLIWAIIHILGYFHKNEIL